MADEKLVLVSEDMPDSVEKIFGFLGYGCVRLPKFDVLDTPVASHPDMLFFALPDGKLLCDKRYYEKNTELLGSCGERFVFSVKELGAKYPYDVAFDTFGINGTVYGRVDSIAPEILEVSEKAVNVNQGYAKCSVLLTDKCAITADCGLYKALTENGVDTLKISPGNVDLPGYGSGFIGGSSFFDPISDTVVFFGDLSAHPDYETISAFLSEHGHKELFDDKIPLTDLGGAVTV